MKNQWIAPEWMPQINQETCTGCGDCILICPTGALGWHRGKAALIHPQLYTYCAVCEEVCPVGAIELPYLIVMGDPNQEEGPETWRVRITRTEKEA